MKLLLIIITLVLFFPIQNILASNTIDELLAEGITSFQSGNFHESISFFDKVLEIDPNHVDALNNRAQIMLTTEQYVRAILDYDRLLEMDPENTLLKQKQLYAKSKVPYNSIDGNLYIEIRNSDGRLIGLQKLFNQFKILGNEIGDNFLRNEPSKTQISKDGKDYEVIQKDHVTISNHTTVVSQRIYHIASWETTSLPVIKTQHWGIMTEKGDVIRSIYTIFRPV